MGRRHRNESCGRFELFSAPTSVGSNLVRKITMREGDGLVAQGKAKLLYDEETQSWWYRLTGGTAKCDAPQEENAKPSCTVMSRAEVYAAAGDFGKSETTGLTTTERKLLESLNRETHDFIERSVIKLETFRPQGSQQSAL